MMSYRDVAGSTFGHVLFMAIVLAWPVAQAAKAPQVCQIAMVELPHGSLHGRLGAAAASLPAPPANLHAAPPRERTPVSAPQARPTTPTPGARPGPEHTPSPAPDENPGQAASGGAGPAGQASQPGVAGGPSGRGAAGALLGNPAGTQRAANLRERLVAALVGRIEQAKRYPFAARKAGIEGVVTMRVRIDESGRIAAYAVRQEDAPHRWLQEASLETMALVDPRLLAEDRLEAALVVEVPIRFHLRE